MEPWREKRLLRNFAEYLNMNIKWTSSHKTTLDQSTYYINQYYLSIPLSILQYMLHFLTSAEILTSRIINSPNI